MQRIKRDDQVRVLAGKERGKQGVVRDVLRREQRVVVQGLNIVKRHRRSTDQRTQAGIIEKEAPIHVSNVKLVCGSCQRATRIRFRIRPDGAKVRVCKACGEDID